MDFGALRTQRYFRILGARADRWWWKLHAKIAHGATDRFGRMVDVGLAVVATVWFVCLIR